jgi:DTW domain-containing protein YfiP
LDPAQLGKLQRLRLVVLDATWRKSRKMLHQNPALQRLPRLALDEVPQSRYAIRKAHAPGQLSTLEATCAALAQLEGDTTRWQPLLAAFDGFVAQQRLFMPNQPLALM